LTLAEKWAFLRSSRAKEAVEIERRRRCYNWRRRFEVTVDLGRA
jgi:transcriptional regulator NrdR family protein